MSARWSRLAAAALAVVALAAAGCGSDAPGDADTPRSDRLVDFTKQPPYVNALDIDPRTRDFLLTTNRGFYRIGRDSGDVQPIRGTISAGGKRSTVGTFLEIEVAGPGRLIGSGHPDQAGALPSFLGFIRSDDTGRTWRVVSRLGDADLHKIVLAHGRMYAFDAVISACSSRATTAARSPRTSRRAGSSSISRSIRPTRRALSHRRTASSSARRTRVRRGARSTGARGSGWPGPRRMRSTAPSRTAACNAPPTAARHGRRPAA